MKKTYLFFIALLGIHLFLLINLQFTAWPEMFSYAYLKNHGFLLYKDMIQPYPPGLVIFLSYIYKIFGYSLETLKVITWFLILSSSLLIFIIAKRITNKESLAFLTLALYVVIQPFLDGNMLWFDIAIISPLLFSFLFYLERKFLLLGIFLGIASLIKQTAGIFLILIFLFLIFKKKTKQGLLVLASSFVVWVPFLVRIIQEKQFTDFWNWTIYYPLFFWKKFPGYVQLSPSTTELFTLTLLVLPILFLFAWKKEILKSDNIQFLLLFLIGAAISIYPRFSFFHFQPTLVFVVLLYGVFLQNLSVFKQYLLMLAFFLFLFPFVYKTALLNWGKEARFYTDYDRGLAAKISKLDKNVYLLGLHSGLYHLSSTLPPKPWTDNFGWYLEIPRVQEEIISRWKKNPADYVIWKKPKQGNWFDLGTYQPPKIVQYIKTNYNEIGSISEEITVWGRND